MLLGGLLATGSIAFQPPARPPLPNVDRRPHTQQDHPLPGERAQALEKLQQSVPGLKVDFDPVQGSPRRLSSPVALLTPKLPPQAAPPHPRVIVREFLDRHRGLFGHGAEALDTAKLTREFDTPRNGLHSMVWQQTFDGLPVQDAFLAAHVTQHHELVSLSSGFMVHPGRGGGGPRTIKWPVAQAVSAGARDLGWTLDPDLLQPLAPLDAAEPTRRVLKAPGHPFDIPTRLVWLPMSRQRMALAWEMFLPNTTRSEVYQLLVDARSGEVVVRRCMTHYLEEATYHVFTSDSPHPMSPGHPVPMTNQPPRISRELLTLDAYDTNASPQGWIPPGINTTTGNNIRAQLDRDGNNQPDLPRPIGNPCRVFDFPLDLDTSPSLHGDASVVQLFYVCNRIHDILYGLGFTEQAGNFQLNNFGRGGVAGDPVDVDAQDGADANNANMTTLPDGTPGRLQMFLFNGPSPARDSTLDAEVVIHEYIHGLSNRRVGAGQGLYALQSSGLGEGWSDFYALALLSEMGDDPNGTYPFGAYSSYLLSGLTQNYYYGIRRYPYTTDMSRNPLTFKDLDVGQADPHAGVPRSPGAPGGATQVHRQGEVWCSALWEVRAELIARHGHVQGQQLVLELVTDGMSLSPSNPNFLEARDGILMADLVNHGGAHQEAIWTGFAKRGMGYSASSPPSHSTIGIVESFDVPDQMTLDPDGDWVAQGAVGGPFQPFQRSHQLSNMGTNAMTWQAATDAAWIEVLSTQGFLPEQGSVEALSLRLRPEADYLPEGVHVAHYWVTNLTSGRVQERLAELRVGQADAFTELFDRDNFDLGYTTLTWTPDGSPGFYSLCRESATEFHVNPAGGNNAFLPDDGYVTVSLPGNMQVPFYGVPRSEMFIGSNGYITFGQGDNRIAPSFERHFDRPRISMLFADLDPEAGGSVTWNILADRVVVTYQRIRVFRTSLDNSWQVELFLDGRVRITWLDIEALNGLAGLSPGMGVPASFHATDLSAFPTCGQSLTLNLPAERTEGDGTLAQAGSLLVDPPFAEERMVVMENLRPDQVTLPGQLIVPAGVATVWFDVAVLDDALLDGSQTVHALASAADYASRAGRMTVHDNEASPLSLHLTNRVREGSSGISGTVQVQAPVDLPVRVHLLSGNPAKLAVPDWVLLDRGGTQAPFTVEAPEDAFIDGAQDVGLSATVTNWPGAGLVVSVEDNEDTVLGLDAPPLVHEAAGHLPGTGHVRLSGVLGTNLAVSLQSSHPVRVAAPLLVTVPAGTNQVAFDLVTSDNGSLDGPGLVTLTASAPGWSNAVAQVGVFDDETPPVPEDPSPSNGEENVEVTTNLAWKLIEPAHGPATLTAFDVYVGTTPILGPGDLQGTTTNRFWNLPELAPGTTYFWQVVARRAGSASGPAWQFTTRGLHRFAWVSIDPNQRVGTPFPVRILAEDERGTVVSNYTGGASLRALASAGTMGPSVVISEVNPGTPDAVEFANVTPEVVAVGNWKVWIYDSSSWPNPRVVFTIPTGSMVAPGQVFRVEELGTAPGTFPLFSAGTNIAWVHQLSGNPILVLLQDTLGNVVDVMAAVNALPADIDMPFDLRVNDWFGDPTPGTLDPSRSFQRIGNADSNDSSDWVAAQATMGVLNPGLATPFTSSQRELLFSPSYTPPFADGEWVGELTAQEPSPRVYFEVDDGAGHGALSNPVQVLMPEDVAVNVVAEPEPVVMGSNVLVRVEVCNAGPSSATGLYLTNALPGGLTFLSHTTSHGSCTQSKGVLTCNLGTLGEGGLARIEILAQANLIGALTNRAVLVRGEADADPVNNLRLTPIHVVSTPAVSVVDAQVLEGTGQTNLLVFTLSLAPPVAHEVSVAYHTEPGSAQAGLDYLEQSGVALFPSGSNTYQVTVPLVGDSMAESNETVFLVLTNPAPAILGQDRATGLILNDDPVPMLSIADVTVLESEGTARLDLSLSESSGLPVTARYAALEASALVGADFQFTIGILSIPAGATQSQITVPLVDDVLNEATESFFVSLNSPTNALFADSSGMVTVLDDDPLPSLSISDAFVFEGEAGQTNATFFVSLAPGSGRTVSVQAVSSNGTAEAGVDFGAVSIALQFDPGMSNLAVTVPVLGDRDVEPDEFFWMRLVNPLYAVLGRQPGKGTLFNDDNPTNLVVRYVWDLIDGPQSQDQAFPVRIRAINALNGVVPTFQGTVHLKAFQGGTAADTFWQEAGVSWEQADGPLTGGYAFTPMEDLLVTHVRHRFGDRVSIWTESGDLMVSQPVTSAPDAWRETPLSPPLHLRARHRYRIAAWSPATAYVAPGPAPASSPHIQLHHPVSWQGDAFPIAGDPGRWFAVGARVLVAATGTAQLTPAATGSFTNGVWAGSVQIHSSGSKVTLWAADDEGHEGGSNPIAVSAVNDLSLTLAGLPESARVGHPVTLRVTTRHSGPQNASNVAVNIMLPAGADLLAGFTSQGSLSAGTTNVFANLGLLAPDAIATIDLQVVPYSAGDTLHWVARAGRAGSEVDTNNNQAALDIQVLEPITIERHPGHQTTLPGRDVTFFVEARSFSPIQYRWFHQDAALPQGTNASLFLPAVSAPQAGRYECVVTDGAFSVTSRVARLNFTPALTTAASGFANLLLPPGYSMLANVLPAESLRIGDVLQNVPQGTTVLLAAQEGWKANNYLDGWSDPEMLLIPGEGFLFKNPLADPILLTLSGKALAGPATNHLPTGLSLHAPLLPRQGGLTTLLGYPATSGDFVLQWQPGSATYSASLRQGNAWWPREPMLTLGGAHFGIQTGEDVWIQTAATPDPFPLQARPNPVESGRAFINVLTLHTNPAYGRVLGVDGVTPVASPFVAQLFVGTTPDPETFQPVGIPAVARSGTVQGTFNGGLAAVPVAEHAQQVFAQLRVWNFLDGVTFEQAVAAQGPSGRSAVLPVVAAAARAGVWPGMPPADFNGFPTFHVRASATNTAPLLAPLPDHILHAGMTLILTNQVSDSDMPAQQMFFNLIASPPGAILGPVSGVFEWTPGDADAPGTNQVLIRVSDDGTPPLGDEVSFQIVVVPRPQVRGMSLEGGQWMLSWDALPGNSYQVQYAEDLNDPVWVDWPGLVVAEGFTASLMDSVQAAPRRFYRIRIAP